MITFRPLVDEDLPRLAAWLAVERVQEWWREPHDLASVTAKYRPRIGGAGLTQVFIIEVDAVAVGMIQRYRHRDDPEWEAAVGVPDAAGIDYLLGAEGLEGRQIGSSAIRLFTPMVFDAYPDVQVVVAVPQQANVASWRALEKAGYRRHWSGELESDDPSDEGPSHVYVIDRPQ